MPGARVGDSRNARRRAGRFPPLRPSWRRRGLLARPRAASRRSSGTGVRARWCRTAVGRLAPRRSRRACRPTAPRRHHAHRRVHLRVLTRNRPHRSCAIDERDQHPDRRREGRCPDLRCPSTAVGGLNCPATSYVTHRRSRRASARALSEHRGTAARSPTWCAAQITTSGLIRADRPARLRGPAARRRPGRRSWWMTPAHRSNALQRLG